MQQIGTFDAKTRFSQLIEQIDNTGEPILITRRGRPVAQLVPPPAAPNDEMTREELFALVRAGWDTAPQMTDAELKAAIAEGRQ